MQILGMTKPHNWRSVLVWICAIQFGSIAFPAEQPGQLSPVIAHVLTHGKNNNIPPAVARALGLSTNTPALGKFAFTTSPPETNAFWVSLQNTNAAVIITRKANMCWYYVTDSSGQLLHAMVNDFNSKLYHGGGTNLSILKEREPFEAQKRKWLDMYGH
jgi:hypothetical protein